METKPDANVHFRVYWDVKDPAKSAQRVPSRLISLWSCGGSMLQLLYVTRACTLKIGWQGSANIANAGRVL